MDDIELYTFGGMTNSSHAMFERRRRILSEARKIIANKGLEGLNIRDLCQRAEVAARTLYNAFGSKENVIALSIRDYFNSFQNRLAYGSDWSTFEGGYEHLITTTLRNLEIPNFLRTVAALYFSPTVHPNIRQVLVEIGGRSLLPWLQTMKLQRQIEKGVEVDRLIVDLSNAQYATVHEWGTGALSDDAFTRRALGHVLLLLAGSTRGAARTQVKAAFADLQADGPETKRLMQAARTRIVESRATGEKALRSAAA